MLPAEAYEATASVQSADCSTSHIVFRESLLVCLELKQQDKSSSDLQRASIALEMEIMLGCTARFMTNNA